MRCDQRATVNLAQQTNQHLMLLPQMQQALVLLQAPLLELAAILREALEANPVWEVLDPERGCSNRQTAAGTAYCEERVVGPKWAREAVAQAITEIFEDRHDRELALRLLHELNHEGLLEDSLPHYASMFNESGERLSQIILACQRLDPPGIFAFSPQQALLLQMERLGRTHTLGYHVLRDHYESVLHLRLKELCRLVGLEEAELLLHLKRDFKGLRKLRPFDDPLNFGLLADASVMWDGTQWTLEIHDEEFPGMRVEPHYLSQLESTTTDSAVGDFLESRYREGFFLKKALHQRSRTLRRILEKVVPLQEAFLLAIEEAPRELTMQQVADQLGLSESTFSRAVSNKWIHAPRGLVALRALFVAPGAVQAGFVGVDLHRTLRQLIASEHPSEPLSDEAIANKMQAAGFQMARRTVAKYRAQLGIPSQKERKWRAASP